MVEMYPDAPTITHVVPPRAIPKRLPVDSEDKVTGDQDVASEEVSNFPDEPTNTNSLFPETFEAV